VTDPVTSPARPIRVAAQLHPQHGRYADMRRAVLEAEEMGFDIVYTWDHFFPLYGGRDGEHFECWTMLAAWAEMTTLVEVGALVTCNSYRNPELLADMARTIDHISGGRLILGIGSGWFRRDYQEYGYEFGTPGSRLDDLARSMPRIEHRLSALNPPPTRDIPVLIAGSGPRKTMRLVANHADSWHAGFPDPGRFDEFDAAIEALGRWCAESGRDPRDVEWGLGVEPDDITRFLREDAPAFVDVGFTQFTLGFQGPDWDLRPGAEWLRWRDSVNG
jgi:probable F420-dependent oxidoreductase